ncbi:MAG: transcription termination factor Rho, partial [Caldilineaceae bacterium]|nr:transcription termination factor Rho [Caldilineaceae bacterium]
NSEIVLDRALAEARIFPAINLMASGTRKEELLYDAEQAQRLIALRRWLAKGTPKAAMLGLLKLLDKTPSNDDLLSRIKPK